MVEIVPFEAKHSEGVINVILPIQQREFDIPITLDAQPDLKDIVGFYRRGMGNFWVALADDVVVGTIALLDIGDRQVALRKMFVAAPYRGREGRVAKRLLDATIGWCAAHRIQTIFLGTTAKFLAAHRFYEKNGFREIEKASLPERFPVMSVDVKFYRLDVVGGFDQPAPLEGGTAITDGSRCFDES